MKKLLFILLMMSQIGTALSQPLGIYSDMYLEPDTVSTGFFSGWEEYSLGAITVYNSLEKNQLQIKALKNDSQKVLLDFKESNPEAKYLKVRFYQAEKQLPTMMMVDLEGEYSWGNYVYWIENGQIFNCGFIPLGVDNFNFSSLGLYAEFTYRHGQMLLEFRHDVSIIDYERDKLIPADKIKYIIRKGSVERQNL